MSMHCALWWWERLCGPRGTARKGSHYFAVGENCLAHAGTIAFSETGYWAQTPPGDGK